MNLLTLNKGAMMCGDPKSEPKAEITLREIIQSNNEMANLVFNESNRVADLITQKGVPGSPKSPEGIRRELIDTSLCLEYSLSLLKQITIQLKDNKPSNH